MSSALTAGGIAADDMTTTEYSIRPEYDYSESNSGYWAIGSATPSAQTP